MSAVRRRGMIAAGYSPQMRSFPARRDSDILAAKERSLYHIIAYQPLKCAIRMN